MIQKTKLWQIQKIAIQNLYQIQKIARALAMLFVEHEMGCTFANPKSGRSS
jgi:hypothetical protein